MTWRLIEADCIEAMQQLEDSSVDAIVTDPPYLLGFMSKPWDVQLDHLAWATEALRVLKPGGFLAAFGGTRTFHRLACAVEDAGFEIRDCVLNIRGGDADPEPTGGLLAWLYGSGEHRLPEELERE